MGTYGYAQFQIDVRKSEDDLKRAIETFKRQSRSDEQKDAQADVSRTNTKINEKLED